MKIYYLLIFIIIKSLSINANEQDSETINLHTSPNLDQLVLEHNELENKKLQEQDSDQTKLEEVSDTNLESSEIAIEESINEEVLEKNSNFISISNPVEIENYLNNLKNIKSNILKNELFNLLESSNFDFNQKNNRDIFYSIIKFFYETGNISKAYNLLKTKNFQDDERLNYYTMIELNYLLSTFQLQNVCNIKNTISKELIIDYFLLEKLDIFCLILEDNLAEAELLNTIIIESENILDENFQKLYIMILNEDNMENEKLNLNKNLNSDLIFLYSAMARIAELPLDENFLRVDPKNLSIPIILNQSSPMDVRIKAATDSYLEEIISIESLSALYQSVDFNSDQLNNSDKTIEDLSDNPELLMAYYFQLINVQIFPSERIEALMNFWKYAKTINLEEVAYSLSYKIVETIKMSSENLNFGPEISTSYIFNKDYEKALGWIDFYEQNMKIDEKSTHVRSLLNLHSATEVDFFLDLIQNYLNTDKNNVKINEELKFILISILDKDLNAQLSSNYENIFDERLMPSMFLIQNIDDAVQNKNNDKFLIFSILSLSDKNWTEIHPEHLKILLNGYIDYKNGIFLKEIIMDIFEDYKIL